MIEPRNVPRSRVGGKYVFKKMLEKVLLCLEGAQQDGGQLIRRRRRAVEAVKPGRRFGVS